MSEAYSQYDFWSAVAQVIPVLGIAVVIEARGSVRGLRLRHKVQRRVEPVVHIINGAFLVLAFGITMRSLSRDTPQPGWLVAFIEMGLLFSFFLLVLNPVIVLALRANVDLYLLLERAFPLGRTARLRRRSRKAAIKLRNGRARIEVLIEKIIIIRSGARSDLEERGLLPETAAAWMESFLGKGAIPVEEQRLVALNAMLIRGVKEYDSRPTRSKAKSLRELRFRFTTATLGYARLVRIGISRAEQDIDDVLAQTARGRLSDKETEFAEATIRRAADASAVNWPIDSL